MKSIAHFAAKDRLLAMSMTPPLSYREERRAILSGRAVLFGALGGGLLWFGAYGFVILLFHLLRAAT
jgi:hypothetical protein